MEPQYLVISFLITYTTIFKSISTLKVDTSSVFLRLYNTNVSTYTDYFINGKQQKKMFTSEGYDASRCSIFISHGFIDSAANDLSTSLSDAFLNRGGYNVIALDWSVLALPPYSLAVQKLKTVGVALAKFLNVAVKQKLLKVGDINLVGHSLGAHLLGYTARGLVTKPPVVVGLDPAGVEFETNLLATKLTSKDAEMVLYLQSNRGMIGTNHEVATCNYVFNPPGVTQPGCVDAVCSHRKVVFYFAEAVKYPKAFTAVKCDSSEKFLSNSCGKTTSDVGFPVDSRCSGTYYLSTNAKPPYSRYGEGTTPVR